MLSKSSYVSVAMMSILASSLAMAQDSGTRDQPPGIPPEMAAKMAQAKANGAKEKEKEFPDFKKVAKDYVKVVSTADGQASLYTLWRRDKDGQMLAELSRGYENQNIFIAYTISGGVLTSGEQVGDVYAKWKRYDKRLALIQPNVSVRTTGDLESQKAHARVFTDRVMLDVPILCIGPGGGPVIDLDGLLVGHSSDFFGFRTAGANTRLIKIAKAKAFPQNVEVAFEMPLRSGQFATLYYSISAIPSSNGFKTRKADSRIGYFATSFMDLGDASADQPWRRYANRWKLEKADPKLRLSPPKQPIVFYLEHTIPIRYRRWVRDGLLEWNKAFERVGLVNAIEVYQQDARTGAHMDKDPEDVRYNFLIWTNAITGYAIGPSRVDPRTGQILDGDISVPEQFITGWSKTWRRYMADRAMENFSPATLAWLQTRPQWDPRVRLATASERPDVLRKLRLQAQASQAGAFASHPAAMADPTLMGDDLYDGLAGRVSQVNGACMNGFAKAMDISLFRLAPDLFISMMQEDDDGAEDEDGDGAEDEDEDEGEDEPKELDYDMLDGVPEWFIGPLLKDLIMHEAGHILGLRHNFKASSAYSFDQINSDEDDERPITGSVMDYTPTNINFDDDKTQGDFTMVTLGEYDFWAIEYGYTFGDTDKVLARVAEPELAFATDDDTWGPDPLARTFDLGANSLDFAESQMNLVHKLRGEIIERMVKDGDSWVKAREGYELLLAKHSSALSIASNWIGGSHVNRDKKGDPGDRDPIEPISAQQQRRALDFVIENAFEDDAYGLDASLLTKMTLEKWWDGGGFWMIFEDQTWPVHDRILGVQATTLTELLNPTTLNRVYDNEFRTDETEDALTLPELMYHLTNAIWSEIEDVPDRNFTNRQPLISSLRRNLQRELLERLIDLSLPNPSLGAAAKPISNLSAYKLRELQRQIDKTMNRNSSRLDTYTMAHLSEASVRIEKALDAQYIYNADDVGGSGGGMPFFFFNPTEASNGK
ncbi:MAG: zinc-dependent metalloprotease [Planctomycetota bacterium]|nr:zinc-dependent metalloprotease [Planctomycetota bacterium]